MRAERMRGQHCSSLFALSGGTSQALAIVERGVVDATP